jgi:mannose-6-phosphate isomerase
MKNSNNSLYPLVFTPIYKEKIWGGGKISKSLRRPGAPRENCGESWEISTIPNNVSIVKGGCLGGLPLDTIIKGYKDQLVGQKVYDEFGAQFPLLIKYIDAHKDLSIQVHPDNELAMKRHNCKGKTEMWYIMEAEKNAKITKGFNKPMVQSDYKSLLSNIGSIFKKVKVTKGDTVFIPAGTVHAIGKGVLLAEIQQSSDVTYRIYDYERKDAVGHKRRLHVNQAQAAISYDDNSYIKHADKYDPSSLVNCPFFKTNKVNITQEVLRDYSSIDSFVVYMMLEGSVKLKTKDNKDILLKRGDTCLIPACIDFSIIEPLEETKMLEIHC